MGNLGSKLSDGSFQTEIMSRLISLLLTHSLIVVVVVVVFHITAHLDVLMVVMSDTFFCMISIVQWMN